MSSTSPDDSSVAHLTEYASKAYLEYALSVVHSRALPFVSDGQKPVQRRILFDMDTLGLHPTQKPSKCARFVGDVLGKYHPHGDSSVYDASVRMAQDFSLRYPLIDGHGNFGSRDGDGAAAMRYTEARLTPITELLLSELHEDTVDFGPNFDGTLQEPKQLPARLPMILLNGASGIAVGMATEIPSHNLREVANACELLVKNPDATLDEVLAVLPAPDFPCGSQIISSPDELRKAYESGRGPVRMRARMEIEVLARNQWQLVITELPPDTSTASILAELETMASPQIKSGKKSLTQDQINSKNLILSLVDATHDDSDTLNPVRLVISPKTSKQDPEALKNFLLANTSLQKNFSMNMVALGLDGRPKSKGLMDILREWVAFRYEVVTRRTNFRLKNVRSRAHILDGRLLVYTNLDAVIELIKTEDSPKEALMAKYGLSEIQAQDVLDIRLRQLARLEKIKLETELASLRDNEAYLQSLLDSPKAMTRLILNEIDADRKKFGDDRRTVVAEAEKVTAAAAPTTTDDPITIIVSKQGWLRARTGHKADLSALTWKPGDSADLIVETRTSAQLMVLDSAGKVFNVAAAAAPTGRGDGVPLASMISLNGASIVATQILNTDALYLMSTSGGYGFLVQGNDLVTRQKAGKVVVSNFGDEKLLQPIELSSKSMLAGEVAVANSSGKLLCYPLKELKIMPKAHGMQLIRLGGSDHVTAIAATNGPIQSIEITLSKPQKKGGHIMTVSGQDLSTFRGKRAQAGSHLPEKIAACALNAQGTENNTPVPIDFGDSDDI